MDPATYRAHVYDIFTPTTEDIESQIDRALELGTEYLDLSLGFFHTNYCWSTRDPSVGWRPSVDSTGGKLSAR